MVFRPLIMRLAVKTGDNSLKNLLWDVFDCEENSAFEGNESLTRKDDLKIIHPFQDLVSITLTVARKQSQCFFVIQVVPTVLFSSL